MSKQRRDWEGSRERGETAQPLSSEPSLAANSGGPGPDAEQFHPADSPEFKIGPDNEPSDDAPTIITKLPRQPAKPDEAITVSLRGRSLAHFELLEPIGVGGMAAVIRAQDKQLDRTVALKILPPAMAADQEAIRRFHQEARAAARLDHENIARVFYCGEDQGLHFIAFEFVEGDNLRTLLDRRGPLPVPEAIKYMLQVAAGLAHAAARGVVHRDIKPSNIIVTPTGRAKLVDMGLARSLEGAGDGGLTQSGVTLGTFDYISPEQALEPREADVRSDIYSLGCTFYHMLTGQPPVPEGTAAKKLHHHQHVAPTDPRQLNPAIPDEVAAVLARMMAKDPKDRYQRPEHLVQHLMQLAHKLGASADVPEGVLFVDAPLPSPPQARPVLVAVVAVAVLVGLVALIGSVPSNTTQPDFRPRQPASAGDTPLVKGPNPPLHSIDKATKQPENPPHVPLQPVRVTARTVEDVTEALKNVSVHIQLIEDQYDLKLKQAEGAGEAPGLVFQGQELVLEPQDPSRRPTLHLGYDTSGKHQPWTALTVHGGKVVLRNLRFAIHAAGTPTPMTAVTRTKGQVRFENCEFIQTGLPDGEKPQLSSVHVGGAAGDGLDGELFDVTCERCYFRGGDQAVLLTGSAGVQLKDCAFGPHTTLFHCRGGRADDPELALEFCSVLMDQGTIFLLTDGAAPRVVFSNSLFSSPGATPLDATGGTVLVRQLGERFGKLRFEPEQRNAFHNLGAYWVQGKRVRAHTLEEFRAEGQLGPKDRSLTMPTSPWEVEQPLTLLAATSPQPRRAFTANMKLPELRTLDTGKGRMIGVQACIWGSLYPAELPPVQERKPEPVVRKERIVDPTRTESSQGVYPTLKEAVAAAQPGDVIYIKHDGPEPLHIAPLRLEDNPDLDLTIKPFEGCRPVLFLGKTNDPDAAMFRLSDGKLLLENLELHLPTPREEFKAQSLAFITGEAQCAFRKCLVTLEGNRDVPLALLTLDPSTSMRRDPKLPSLGYPRLRLENCVVRGEGHMVTVRGSQAFQLDLDNALVALDGSMVVVDGNPKEPPTKPPVQINLNRVTAYLTEHLILLKACESKAMPGLVPTQVVKVSQCLFASGREKNSLIHLDGMESDEQMKRLFFWAWEEGKQNVYSGFTNLLEQRPRAESSMTLPQYDKGRWEDFAPKEMDRRYDKVTLAGWPGAEQPLSRAPVASFRIKTPSDLLGVGADLDLLPRSRWDSEPPPNSSREE